MGPWKDKYIPRAGGTGRDSRDGFPVELSWCQLDLLGRCQGLHVREAAGVEVGEELDPTGP